MPYANTLSMTLMDLMSFLKMVLMMIDEFFLLNDVMTIDPEIVLFD